MGVWSQVIQMGNCFGSQPAADPTPFPAINNSSGPSTQGFMLLTLSGLLRNFVGSL